MRFRYALCNENSFTSTREPKNRDTTYKHRNNPMTLYQAVSMDTHSHKTTDSRMTNPVTNTRGARRAIKSSDIADVEPLPAPSPVSGRGPVSLLLAAKIPLKMAVIQPLMSPVNPRALRVFQILDN